MGRRHISYTSRHIVDLRVPGAVKLEAYLDKYRLKQQTFGDFLGVSGVTVHRWVEGKALPSRRLAVAIERVTQGAIPALFFFPEFGGD